MGRDRRAPEECGRVEHPLFQPGVVLGAKEEGWGEARVKRGHPLFQPGVVGGVMVEDEGRGRLVRRRRDRE